MTDHAESKPIDRWLPWLIVPFFLVVFIANGIMVYVGATTWTGLETKQYYIKGLDYNETLQEEARQKALGWTAGLSVEPKERNTVRLDFSLLDRRNLAIAGADVSARLVRPTSEGHDVEIHMDDFGSG